MTAPDSGAGITFDDAHRPSVRTVFDPLTGQTRVDDPETGLTRLYDPVKLQLLTHDPVNGTLTALDLKSGQLTVTTHDDATGVTTTVNPSTGETHTFNPAESEAIGVDVESGRTTIFDTVTGESTTHHPETGETVVKDPSTGTTTTYDHSGDFIAHTPSDGYPTSGFEEESTLEDDERDTGTDNFAYSDSTTGKEGSPMVDAVDDLGAPDIVEPRRVDLDERSDAIAGGSTDVDEPLDVDLSDATFEWPDETPNSVAPAQAAGTADVGPDDEVTQDQFYTDDDDLLAQQHADVPTVWSDTEKNTYEIDDFGIPEWEEPFDPL